MNLKEMYKRMTMIKGSVVSGTHISLKEIYKRMTLTAKGNIIGSVTASIRESKTDPEPIDVKIVFAKDRSSKNCLAVLSTDTTISNEEIIRIYGKRWDIEVFFKVSKSYLALAKEFQGRSYDMMLAHTTIIFMRYAMLTLESRNSNDPRTIGDLFYYLCDEIEDIKFSTSLLHYMLHVRTKEWKYLFYQNGGFEELYHLKEDPHELVDLADDKTYAGIKKEQSDAAVERILKYGNAEYALDNKQKLRVVTFHNYTEQQYRPFSRMPWDYRMPPLTLPLGIQGWFWNQNRKDWSYMVELARKNKI